MSSEEEEGAFAESETPLTEACVAMHVLFEALIAGGFQEKQALLIIANYMLGETS